VAYSGKRRGLGTRREMLTRERERQEERRDEAEEREKERTIGAVVLYVETLIGVTCSETSYRRVALIFRGSYMPVERERERGREEEGKREADMCGGGTRSTQRLIPRTHVVFHDGNRPADAASSLAR